MKTAIIGLGCISVNHIEAILNEGSTIVGLCDIKVEKCENANKKYSLNAQIFSDYKKMLTELDVDVVHICTPHYLHAEMIIFALNNNINVLTEKPLAINLEQLKQIEQAVKISSKKLGVCQQNRFNPTISYVKEVLKGEKIISAYGNLTWNRDENYYSQDVWRGKYSTEGGGVMINQALHTLDLLQYFVGYPNSCIATTFNHTHNIIEVEDTAFAIFKGKDFNFIINATNSAKVSFPIVISLATNDKIIQISGDNVTINGEVVTIPSVSKVVGKSDWGSSHFTLVKEFYNSILNNQEFAINFYEAEKVIHLILTMYNSNGKEIKIL